MSKGKYYRIISNEIEYLTKIPEKYWQDAMKNSLIHKLSIVDIDDKQWEISMSWALADRFGDGCELEEL